MGDALKFFVRLVRGDIDTTSIRLILLHWWLSRCLADPAARYSAGMLCASGFMEAQESFALACECPECTFLRSLIVPGRESRIRQAALWERGRAMNYSTPSRVVSVLKMLGALWFGRSRFPSSAVSATVSGDSETELESSNPLDNG